MNFRIDPSFTPVVHSSLSAEAYHADLTAVGSSQLKRILKSPASFKAQFGASPEESDAFRFGTLVHLAVLEPQAFRERCVVMPEFSGTTKDGRPSSRSAEATTKRNEWIAAMKAENRITCTQEEMNALHGIVASVSRHSDAKALLQEGTAEQSIYFAHERTGVVNKVRPDWVNPRLRALVDIKTTQDCSLDAFSKTIWNYRYDFQMAMYSEGVSQTLFRPKTHAYIVIEKAAPYEVAVYYADDELLTLGWSDYNRANALLAKCLKTNDWDCYQQKAEVIGLPAHAAGRLTF